VALYFIVDGQISAIEWTIILDGICKNKKK